MIEAKSVRSVLLCILSRREGSNSRSHYPVAVVGVRETWMLFYERLAHVLTMLARGSGLTGCSFSFARFDLCAALRCWSLVCLIFFFFFLSVHSTQVYNEIVFDATPKSRVRPVSHTLIRSYYDSYIINKQKITIHNMCAARIFVSFVNDKTDNMCKICFCTKHHYCGARSYARCSPLHLSLCVSVSPPTTISINVSSPNAPNASEIDSRCTHDVDVTR